MANIEALMKKRQREKELYEQHKKAAAKLDQEIEFHMNQELQKKVNRLNLNMEEYSGFLKILNSKESLLEAVQFVESGKSDKGAEYEDKTQE